MEFDPWYEGAHRQLMRAVALDGQRGAALSHFHNCQTLLARDLGAEPEDQTIALFESIRAGRRQTRQAQHPATPAKNSLHTPADADPPLFVGRAQELATLHRLLDEALEGKVALCSSRAARAAARPPCSGSSPCAPSNSTAI